MRPRPGRIEEIIEVPMKRPRSTHLDDVETSGDFTRITGMLWERLRGMHSEVRRKTAESQQPASGA
jgi:hypothetical protein